MNIENNINILGNFCGMRDVDRLSADAIQRKYGFTQADVMVLFGHENSLLSSQNLYTRRYKPNFPY